MKDRSAQATLPFSNKYILGWVEIAEGNKLLKLPPVNYCKETVTNSSVQGEMNHPEPFSEVFSSVKIAKFPR